MKCRIEASVTTPEGSARVWEASCPTHPLMTTSFSGYRWDFWGGRFAWLSAVRWVDQHLAEFHADRNSKDGSTSA